jgi:hypothetical protein
MESVMFPKDFRDAETSMNDFVARELSISDLVPVNLRSENRTVDIG